MPIPSNTNESTAREASQNRASSPLPSSSIPNGISHLEDFPLPEAGTDAPIHHTHSWLSYSDLASECESKRHAVPKKYHRMSRPVPMMRSEYDVVVIGSGYGGAVAASRMARADKSVCLLELGKERWPGEFPSDFRSAFPEIHVTGDGSVLDILDGGDPQGLYHLILGDGQSAFVANGLGGTSLLNANVFLEADPRTLSQDSFPPEIRDNPNCLDKYYKLAKDVLQPVPYPEDFPTLPKLKVLEQQAELMGPDYKKRFKRVPLTTTFKDGFNNMGVFQHKSTLSGEDSTGINDGSKNSTLMNYLPDAWNHGAEIFCGCEVRYIKPCTKGPNKWTVHFAWLGEKRGKFKDMVNAELMWVQAKEFVFLGAGAIGTTEILLRSSAYGLKVSPTLGMNMSGNGDILAFGYNGNMVSNAIGTQKASYLRDHPVGPTITGIIDMRDEAVASNVLDGYVIEEGAVPSALAGVLQPMFDLIPGQAAPTGRSLPERLRELKNAAASQVLGAWKQDGSLNRTMIYLVMSHDGNQAALTLKENKPSLEFIGVGRSPHVEKLNRVLQSAANKIGARFIPNPFSASQLGHGEITVHPIGGANMSSDGTGVSGVTDHFGQVFKGNTADVYDGLVVVDGSVVPRALGVNPFATITALAERSVAGVAETKGIKIDYESKNGEINWAAPKKRQELTEDMLKAQNAIEASPRTGGARFTEIMEGYLYVGDDIKDYDIAVEAAKGSNSTARFYLSVDAWDIETLTSKDNHAAMLTGTFSCGALSKDPFMVLRGEFQLFSPDLRTPETDNLMYNFDMISTSGEIIHFHGYKIVNSKCTGSICNTWKATTTLYVKLSRPDKSIVGCGILTISWRNFITELITFRGIGATSATRALCTKRFMTYFGSKLATHVSTLLGPSENSHTILPGCFQSSQPTNTIMRKASDGIQFKMHIWTPSGVTETKPILLVPGASTDHQMYALPTIPYNFVHYLLDHGYTVYCVNHRVGRASAAGNIKKWTTYDARLDIAAAAEYILEETKVPKVYAVAHCAGAIAMAAGLLDGTIQGIGGLTASQVFMHPWFADVNMKKAKIRPSLTWLYKDLVSDWFNVVGGDDSKIIDNFLNLFYPEGGRQDDCHSIVCHRSELVFGRLWSHEQLNDSTHQNLGCFVGGVSMKNLEQLMFMGTHGYVVDNDMHNILDQGSLERLRDIRIFFIHGAKNAVYDPISTDKDLDELTNSNLNGNGEHTHFTRHVFEDRGHLDCWMGRSSFKDVYPMVEQHASQTINSFSDAVNGTV